MIVTWHLQDVEEQNRLHPRSFFIPSAEERQSLKPGMQVKLVFIPDQPASHEAERMWVTVEEVTHAGQYLGALDNDPVVITELSAGDRVAFAAKHVARIWSDELVDFPASKKALANRRIVLEDIQPQVLIFEHPESASDSGWTLLLGTETADEMNDRATFVGPNLGWIAERYPAIVPVLRGAVPGVHVWDESRSGYRFDGPPAS